MMLLAGGSGREDATPVLEKERDLMIEPTPLIYALRHTLHRAALSSGIGSLIKFSVIEGFVMFCRCRWSCRAHSCPFYYWKLP